MEAMADPVEASDPPADDDGALARAAAAGDSPAFERLYRRHVSRVYGLCWRLCDRDRARAEQATQDAFVRAWERLDTFRGEAPFGLWLRRVAVNVALGEHRLLKRWVNFEDTVLDTPKEPRHDDPDAGLERDLERALARLPKGARAVLLLHDVEGYRHEEIAQLTGIAVGTSKAQLHRARKLMKEHLQ
jgi:RNA polymerase sigma-70 factor (ECF subfamily)